MKRINQEEHVKILQTSFSALEMLFFVKIELGYRRYVVMACNSIYISDSDNSTSLNKSFTPEFYGHFLTTWRAIRAACK